jgi:pilus assembly protein CpaE
MPEKTRVLVVDDIAETRENVRKLLQFEADIEVAGAARSGREAIQLTEELKPDVVLMDINMPDMDGITATEMIRQRNLVTQIIILSVQGDPNYMRKAMLAGARDFLTKPPMADELISAVRRAGEMARQERAKSAQVASNAAVTAQPTLRAGLSNGRVVMVYSPKGGTGVTTLAVNLAITLHNEETRAVLVDGNLQFGDVAVFLNEQGKNTILDLAPRADELEPEIVESVMIKHAASGLHVLAAPSRPEHADHVNSDQFGKLVKYLRQLYAYVVIDTAHMLNDITLATIDVSDVIILVVTQDIPAIKNARLFLDLLSTIGVKRDRICFVMNRYDKRITISPEKVGENLKQPVVGVIPLDERIVIPSVNRGVPFMLDNKTQPCARSVFSLAEAVRAQISKLEKLDE